MTKQEIKIINNIASKQAAPQFHQEELVSVAILRVLEDRAKGKPADEAFLVISAKLAMIDHKERLKDPFSMPSGSRHKLKKRGYTRTRSLEEFGRNYFRRKIDTPEEVFRVEEIKEKACLEKDEVEKKVVEHLAEGFTFREIADKLGVTVRAVNSTKKRIEKVLIDLGYLIKSEEKRYADRNKT
jgi:DNA-directed RNA polymerase specialized sigma24 family protein